jgi:hypothetical protein
MAQKRPAGTHSACRHEKVGNFLALPRLARAVSPGELASLSRSLTYTNTAVQPTEATWWWWNRPWGGGWGWNGEEGCAGRREAAAGTGAGRLAREGSEQPHRVMDSAARSLRLSRPFMHTRTLSLSLPPLTFTGGWNNGWGPRPCNGWCGRKLLGLPASSSA